MCLHAGDVVHVERVRPIAIVGVEVQLVRREGVARAEPHAQQDVDACSDADVVAGRALQRPLALGRTDDLQEKPIGRRESTVHERIPVGPGDRSTSCRNRRRAPSVGLAESGACARDRRRRDERADQGGHQPMRLRHRFESGEEMDCVCDACARARHGVSFETTCEFAIDGRSRH